jgi:hypothetical protein
VTEPDRRALQRYLDRPLDDLMEDLALYDSAERSLTDVWSKVAGPLRQRLCVEWDYCKVRENPRLDDDLELAVAVVAVLSEPVLQLPIPADRLLLAAILVKRGLDVFCGCP